MASRDKEKGTWKGEITYCTVNGTDCPYYKNGVCHIDNPVEDRDDFAAFFPTWKDWEEA